MAKKQSNNETDFVNPFNPGVTYEDFTKALGEKSVKEYCKDQLTEEQITWLEHELEHFKNNK